MIQKRKKKKKTRIEIQKTKCWKYLEMKLKMGKNVSYPDTKDPYIKLKRAYYESIGINDDEWYDQQSAIKISH